jgi:hypothetical protein
MTLKTFTAGEVLTADDVNEYLVNTLFVRKTSTESVTSSTALQNDNELVLAVEANCVYELTGTVIYDGSTTGDIQWDFTLPSGAVMSGIATRLATGGTDTTAFMQWDTESVTSAGALGTGTETVISLRHLVVVSSTAGNVQLRWSQNTSDGTATRVFANSYLCLRRVA